VAGPVRHTTPTIEELQASFSGPLYLYALRRLGDRQAAEEVVQDTLLAAWRHADRYDPDRGSVATWLFSIARNLTVDRGRRRSARPRLVAAAVDRPDRSVVTDAERALEAWQLSEAIASLSLEHREAIVEVHYLGYTVREAAARLGVPEGTVKSRLYYGIRALRLRLEELGVVG
jgi:RNA polymerase sigma-70 factor, ECF subfamily